MRGRAFALIATLLALAIGALVWAVGHFVGEFRQATTEPPSSGKVLIVSEFELVDQDGRPVRGQDLRDKLQLVFFGFTTCPDICPDDADQDHGPRWRIWVPTRRRCAQFSFRSIRKGTRRPC